MSNFNETKIYYPSGQIHVNHVVFDNGDWEKDVYDERGNKIEISDSTGETMWMKYDDLNRHIETRYNDGYIWSANYDENGKMNPTTNM